MVKQRKLFFIICIVLFPLFIGLYANIDTFAKDNNNQPGEWIQSQNGKWWYKYDDGTWPYETWLKISDKWYYFDAEGWMKTGWFLDGDNWYYLNPNGSMCTGWIWHNNKWYFCKKNGAMKTGWLHLGSKWYFFDQSGAMKTGWIKVKKEWYYMYENGTLYLGPIDKDKADESIEILDHKLASEGFERISEAIVIDHWMNWLEIKEMFSPVYGAFYAKMIPDEKQEYGGIVMCYRVYRLDNGELYQETMDQLK